MDNMLITAAMLTAIVLPIIILGIQDARARSWRPTNKPKRHYDAKYGVDSDYMAAVKGGSKTLAEYHRKALAEGLERKQW